ncbi:cation:proton antiporter, partial [Candidatus Fermentibacterales bacterium]|nr:cation:proton antiporter [Candidatus Fermentibacterales bacterium]
MPDIGALTLVGLAVLVGLHLGKVARRAGLPSLIGFLVTGAIAGPSALGFFTRDLLDGLSFITQIALGFVAFTIGSELSMSSMRRLGRSIVVIIFGECFLAFGLVAIAVYAVTGDLAMGLIFGAMAPASAPAGTVAVIQEYRARGDLTRALYAVVGFDDGLAILIYGFAAAFARSLLVGEASGASQGLLSSMADPATELGLSFVVGGALGVVYVFLQRRLRHGADVPALTFGFVAVASGLAERMGLSLILVNMMIGFVLANARGSNAVPAVSKQLRPLMPLLFVLFFFLAGAHLEIGQLGALGLIGAVYILGRSAGLLLGAWSASVLTRAQEKIRKYLGF